MTTSPYTLNFDNLKFLTLKQPWPAMFFSELIGGFPAKRIENREWHPREKGARIGDTILLHGGKEPESERQWENFGLELRRIAIELMGKSQKEADLLFSGDLSRFLITGIYAVATIDAVIDIDEVTDIEALKCELPWFMGRYGFVLGNFTPILPSVKQTGGRGFQKPDASALAAILRQLGVVKEEPDDVESLIAAAQPVSKPTIEPPKVSGSKLDRAALITEILERESTRAEMWTWAQAVENRKKGLAELTDEELQKELEVSRRFYRRPDHAQS